MLLIMRYITIWIICNEQVYLRISNRVCKKTWNNWQEGMRTNFELKTFNDTLTEVFEKLPSNFNELQRVKALDFSTDPKQWKIYDYFSNWILACLVLLILD